MPRLPRISVEGAIYYVTSKAIQTEGIFKDKEDYGMYLDLVKKYKSQHKFKLYSYCLLPDRLELLIETGDDASISEIMHDLNSLYTKYFNGRYQKRGHLFESRFRSVLVEKIQYLAAITRHIHRAPPNPREYAYSSFHVYLDAPSDTVSPNMKSEVNEVLEFLRQRNNPASYEKYVLEGDAQEIASLSKSLRRGQVLGSEAFQESVKKKVEEHVEDLKEAAAPARPNPMVLVFVGAFVLLATGTSIYLYVDKREVETRYTQLLIEKEQQFTEQTRFENRSPIALTELDGTSWRVDLVQLPAGTSKAALHDTVHFSEGLFWSDRGKELGFQPARYTILVRPGGLTTWEVLQGDGRGNYMSWRGDWQGDLMKGMVRHTPAGNQPRVFSFYSAGWSYQDARVSASEGGVR